MRLEQMPPPSDPEKLLERAYARATNWILLQLRDGRLPRPSLADLPAITESVERFLTAFQQDDAAATQAAPEQQAPEDEANDEEEEETEDQEEEDAGESGEAAPDPYPSVTAIWRQFANGWLPPFKVQRQRNHLRKLVQQSTSTTFWSFIESLFKKNARKEARQLLNTKQYNAVLTKLKWPVPLDLSQDETQVINAFRQVGVLVFMQQRFDGHVRDLLDKGDYATLVLMSNWINCAGDPVDLPQGYNLVALPHDYEPDYRMRPVSEAIVRRLRQGEYADIAAEHLDSYEVLLDLLFLLPPLDPLGVDPVE